MKTLFAITLLCFAAFGAERVMAQGFADEPTCYSWEGGSKSAGSFTKCPGPWIVAKAPAPAAAAPVVAAPVLSSPVCPPQIILQPEPKKAKPKRPAPKPLKC